MQSAKIQLTFSDGQAAQNWITLETKDAFTNALSSLSFTVAPPPSLFAEYRKRLRKSEIVGLVVDGKPQFAGIVWESHTTVGPDGGAVISGTAYCALKLLYQSTVDRATESRILQADAPIIDLVGEVLGRYEIGVAATEDVALIRSRTGKSSGATSTRTSGLTYREAQAQDNESAMGFVNRVLTRNGVMLRMDSAAILAYITAPHYDGQPLYTLKQCPAGTGPAGNSFYGNVEETDSNEGQYSFCETMGAGSDGPGSTQSHTPRARVNSRQINPDRPPFRSTATVNHCPVYHRDPNCRDTAAAERVSTLVLGLKAEDAYSIRGTVHGLTSIEGVPWTVDTLARVYLPKLGIDEVMWISERTFRADASGGQSTELVLLPKGNLQLGELPS